MTMSPRRRLCRVLLLLATLCLATAATAQGATTPTASEPSPELASALGGWVATNPATSAQVWRLDPGGPVEVLSYRADTPRTPASTMKLVTGASALITLGPTFRFETRLYADATAVQSGSTLSGAVYLKGYGDPLLSTSRYSRRFLEGLGGNLYQLVGPLRAAGITRIDGPILVDETLFDSVRRGPTWPSRFRNECQPLSAMTVNQSWQTDEHRRYVSSPPRAAGNQLRQMMKRSGVLHNGGIAVRAAPEEGRLLATARSAQLSRIVRLMERDSDNFIAEMLLKNVGAYAPPAAGLANFTGRSSTQRGTQAEAALMSTLGVSTPGDVLTDGSGLALENRLTTRTLLGLLSEANRDAVWGPHLIGALPAGGEGTLKRRLTSLGKRVRAKTGTLTRTTTLAGLVESDGGQRYAFAFLMNNSSVNGGRATQDKLVQLIASGVADVPVPAPA